MLFSSQLQEEEGDVAPFSYVQEKIQCLCVWASNATLTLAYTNWLINQANHAKNNSQHNIKEQATHQQASTYSLAWK